MCVLYTRRTRVATGFVAAVAVAKVARSRTDTGLVAVAVAGTELRVLGLILV